MYFIFILVKSYNICDKRNVNKYTYISENILQLIIEIMKLTQEFIILKYSATTIILVYSCSYHMYTQ